MQSKEGLTAGQNLDIMKKIHMSYVVGVETYFITYFTAVQKVTLLQRTIHDLLWNTRDGRRIKFNFTEFFCAVGVAIL